MLGFAGSAQPTDYYYEFIPDSSGLVGQNDENHVSGQPLVQAHTTVQKPVHQAMIG